jgi:tellurite resistance protein
LVVTDSKNVHQKRSELVRELNFLWHSPALSDDDRKAVLEELESILRELRAKAIPASSS